MKKQLPPVALIRVSTDKQELETQKMKILEYANAHDLKQVHFVELEMSTRKQKTKDEISGLIESLEEGQIFIAADLLRTGRDLIEIIRNVNRIVEKNIEFITLKENIHIPAGKKELDIATKMIVYQFGMLGELERDLTSIRTKERLQLAKKRGVKLGRKKGSKGKSKLDGKEQEIAALLDKKVSKASIARIMNVSSTTMKHFIKTRSLKAKGS